MEDFFAECFWRIFFGGSFWLDFFGRNFLGRSFGRNSLFTLLKSAKLIKDSYSTSLSYLNMEEIDLFVKILVFVKCDWKLIAIKKICLTSIGLSLKTSKNCFSSIPIVSKVRSNFSCFFLILSFCFRVIFVVFKSFIGTDGKSYFEAIT